MAADTKRLYLGIFLISVATLVLEIGLTRLLSVAFWHHFAFLVISIALFGLAASGTYLTLRPSTSKLEDSLSTYSLLFSLTALGGFVIINMLPFDPFRFFLDKTHVLLIIFYYILLSLPFFFFGLCISLSFTGKPEDSGRIYFANLSGSGIGALIVLWLFIPFGGGGVLLISALTALIASIVFSKKKLGLAASAMAVFILIYIISPSSLEINISPYKPFNLALLYPDSRVISTEWNSISRVDVIESGYVRYAPGLSLAYQAELPPQLGLVVDGSGVSAVTAYKGTSVEFTRHLTSALPYSLKPGVHALVIESGGGLEALLAVSNRAKSVKVLESNPLIIKTLRDLDEFSPVLADPNVEFVEADARSYLQIRNESFDVIEIGLSSSAPASSTGVYALTENYLFTVEAFKDYLKHLSEDGFLSITRRLEPPPREALRTVAIAYEALKELGHKNPENHIAAIRSLSTITILIKPTPLSRDDLKGIRDFSHAKRFDIVYLPELREEETNIYNRFPIDQYHASIKGYLEAEDKKAFGKSYLFEISPPRDEKPFFYQFFKPDRLGETYKSVGEKWQVFLEGGFILYLLLLQAGILCLILVFGPLLALKKYPQTTMRASWPLTFFFLLGIGFMFIEIPLIQKFILYLGKPIYAISSVLFSILIFSGIGSYYTSLSQPTPDHLRRRISFLVVLAILYMFFLTPLLNSARFNNLTLRLIASSLFLAPIGLLMGMPLPTAIRLLKGRRQRIIPWVWAANGSASVLGSVLAVIVAMEIGFTGVVALAMLSYALANLAVVKAFAPRQQEEQTEPL